MTKTTLSNPARATIAVGRMVFLRICLLDDVFIFALKRPLASPSQQIKYPTSPDVNRSLLTAMAEDVGFLAPCFFEGVSQDGQAVEGTAGVNPLCDPDDCAVIPDQP